MKIGIATDHRGVETKQELTKYLKELGYDVIDYGTNTEEAVDYPHYAFKIGEAVVKKDIDYGILICRTGIGMSIACNKVNGVRCAKVSNVEEASLTRIDNDANVLSLGYNQPIDELKNISKVFLETKHLDEERHDRRISLVDIYNG